MYFIVLSIFIINNDKFSISISSRLTTNYKNKKIHRLTSREGGGSLCQMGRVRCLPENKFSIKQIVWKSWNLKKSYSWEKWKSFDDTYILLWFSLLSKLTKKMKVTLGKGSLGHLNRQNIIFDPKFLWTVWS